MAVPRPLLLTLLGTVLLAVTFMAMRNSSNTSEKAANSQNAAPPAKPAQQPSTPAEPAKPAALSAQDAVRAVMSPGTPIRSARFALRIRAKELGGKRRAESFSASGAFDRGAASAAIPSFDVSVRTLDGGRRDSARVVAAAGKGFATRRGEFHELSGVTLRTTTAARRALTGARSGTAKVAALDPAGWTRRLKAEAGPSVGGVATTHVSGRVDSRRLAGEIRRAIKGAGPGTPRLPRGSDRALRRGLANARLDAWVGTQDKIARRVRLAVTGPVPRSMLDRGETARWRTVLTLSLAQVNRPQQVDPPREVAKSRLRGRTAREVRGTFLLAAIATDPPAGALQLGLGLARLQRLGEGTRTPRAVERAVRSRKRVVIFFAQPGGYDDPVTEDSVRSLRQRTKASVFTDSVDNIALYGQIVQSAGVSRAPSVVVIGRDRKARLIEGYVDPETLAQEVADSR